MKTLPEPLERIGRTHIRWRGRTLVYFGGCDYFRFARHPAVLRAAERCLRQHGLNVAASRRTTGNHSLYERLERTLAKFFRAETATLVGTGSSTNLIVVQAFAGEFTHALVDERAHPCLADVALLLNARVIRFPHRDPVAVGRLARKLGARTRIVLLTDGLFAHDGRVAPLRDFRRALPANAWLLVDDAHGAGVIGSNGRGSLEHEGISRERVIQTLTLSKAFGAYGGAILGSVAVRERIFTSGRLFTGSTPPPLPAAAAALVSIQLLAAQPARRARLANNAGWLRSSLLSAGVKIDDTQGPIITITPSSAERARKLREALLAHNILPPFLKYPGSPPDGCFRFVISSEHTRSQLTALVRGLRSC